MLTMFLNLIQRFYSPDDSGGEDGIRRDRG